MDQIVYHDRYRGETRVEQIYGDAALRWTYGTPLGNLSLNTIVKRAIFSRWYGRKMNSPKSRNKIAPFIEQYELDPDEFVLTPAEFNNFNEFFSANSNPTRGRSIPIRKHSYSPPTDDICASRICRAAADCLLKVKCSA